MTQHFRATPSKTTQFGDGTSVAHTFAPALTDFDIAHQYDDILEFMDTTSVTVRGHVMYDLPDSRVSDEHWDERACDR